ncbi:hypothetical protein B9Z65_2201 [Elsinoe australis]|uniref:Transcriptional regulatory protein RXT2 N-terminal domain-containing protein n=1 Tax=Elsinoe australis TaxID=40998 RepID=A0A2P7YND2_9PEZI|nr:hypothetical protein B9Z65_2201 [Elsinoe australis]
MASQQTIIAETIRAMKLALKRKGDESDSDDSIRQHTNRGNKLKRKAHHIREGRLDTSGGHSYRKRIEHAGYQRYIIHENPPMYDHDGDLVDPDEEYDEDNMSPAEENPFEETKLEHILMPLNAPGDLADHPGLSVPYTTKHITEMAENAREMLHRERETIAKMKALLERFRGDDRWVPLESVETVQDPLLLDGDGLDPYQEDKSVVNSASAVEMPRDGSIEAKASADHIAKPNGSTNNILGIQMQAQSTNGVNAMDMAVQKAAHVNGDAPPEAQKEITTTNGIHKDNAVPTTNGDDHMDTTTDDAPALAAEQPTTGDDNAGNQEDDGQPSHAMTTRAKARTPPLEDGGHSVASDAPSSLPAISNFFIPAASSLPDQTLGLPLNEADDTKRLLLLYVQKQEEVVRGIEQLMFGLLKVDRLRKEVYKWCKADGHMGEMSDGEDWYDKDDWGLTEDLVKGKEEEEVEDETKRRGRRREGKGRNTGA